MSVQEHDGYLHWKPDDDVDQLVSSYRGKSIDELKSSTSVRWAVGKAANYLRNLELIAYRKQFKVIWTDSDCLLRKAATSLDPTLLWDQPRGHNGRIALVIRHWAANKFMDPVIAVIKHGYPQIADGRHRLLVAYHWVSGPFQSRYTRHMWKLISLFFADPFSHERRASSAKAKDSIVFVAVGAGRKSGTRELSGRGHR